MALAIALGGASSVRAAPADAPTPAEQAAEHSAAAVAAFDQRDYDGAIAAFSRAYDLDPQPNFLFNIGRVYEEKGELRNALKYYQQFLEQPGVELEARQAATERMKVLREAIAQIDEPGAKADSPAPTPTDPAREPAPSTDVDPSLRERDQKLVRMRIAGGVLAGVGGGLLVGGAIAGGLALRSKNDAEDAMFVDERLDLRDQAKTRAAAADGLIISGAVLAVVGVALLLATIRRKPARSSRNASAQWSPRFGAGSAGLAVAGRF